MSIEEQFIRAIEGQRDEARLNAIYWRNKLEAEVLAHRATQKRYALLLKHVAAVNQSTKRVAETAKNVHEQPAQQQQEPVAVVTTFGKSSGSGPKLEWLTGASVAVGNRLYTSPPASKPLTVLMITTAYEQGVGKGHQAYRRKEKIENPYTPGDCHEAWQLGYKEGKTQAGDIKDAPANKPWVGLTDEEIKRMAAPWFLSMYWKLCITFGRAIEAKLREKNA